MKLKHSRLYRALAMLALVPMAMALGAVEVRAQPQTQNVSPPSETKAVTPTGVDMRSGQYQYQQTDLAIGGDGGLALERTPKKGIKDRTNPFGNFSHNWDIFIMERSIVATYDDKSRALINFGKWPVTSSGVKVSFGNRSESFFAFGQDTYYLPRTKQSAAGLLKYTGDRTTSSALYTYETKSGDKVEFRAIGSKDCAFASTNRQCAFASKVTMANGTEYVLEYDEVSSADNNTRLRSVTSSNGYALLFEYTSSSSNVQVSNACVINLAVTAKPANNICPAGALQDVSYSYTSFKGEQKLASVTTADNAVYSFTYADDSSTADAFETSYFQPGETTPWLVQVTDLYPNEDLDHDEIVKSQNFADGTSYDYSFHYTSGLSAETDPRIIGGTYTNNENQQVGYIYSQPAYPGFLFPLPPIAGALFSPNGDVSGLTIVQPTSGPTTIIDELGRITRLEYCDKYYRPGSVPGDNPPELPGSLGDCVVQEHPLAVTTPDGNRIEYSYDGVLGVVTEEKRIAASGNLPDITRSYAYGCLGRKCNTKPTSVTDGEGNVTTYTYDPAHGGMLSEVGPAVNGVSPAKKYSYVQRYAWFKDSSGSYVQGSSQTWLLSEERSCENSALDLLSGACAGNDAVVTTYDYGPDSGPNNLLLRGVAVTADGETLRTCYTYDDLGRRTSETPPRANLGSCP